MRRVVMESPFAAADVGSVEMPPDGKSLSNLIDQYVVREGERQ